MKEVGVRPILAVLLAAACAPLMGHAAASEGQDTPSMYASVPAESSGVARVPFGPGELARYKVTVGLFGGVGRGSMEISAVDTLRGRACYRIRFDLKGGVPFAKVDDHFESWLDVSSLASRRFEQRQKEVKFRRERVFDFYPEERRWVRVDKEGAGDLPTDAPLDDVSFLYFVRTLDLEVGKTYTLDRYFKADGNPVVIEVVRKERIQVPIGNFDTIVVRPVIRASGLFAEGGEAELYFTDDDRHILIQMRSRVPILGHLHLLLESYRPGRLISG
jgi:hypothetical protein